MSKSKQPVISEEERIKRRVKKTWEVLNRYGIYTEQQLDQAIKNTPPVDIGCMISPVNISGRQDVLWADKGI